MTERPLQGPGPLGFPCCCCWGCYCWMQWSYRNAHRTFSQWVYKPGDFKKEKCQGTITVGAGGSGKAAWGVDRALVTGSQALASWPVTPGYCPWTVRWTPCDHSWSEITVLHLKLGVTNDDYALSVSLRMEMSSSSEACSWRWCEVC